MVSGGRYVGGCVVGLPRVRGTVLVIAGFSVGARVLGARVLGLV